MNELVFFLKVQFCEDLDSYFRVHLKVDGEVSNEDYEKLYDEVLQQAAEDMDEPCSKLTKVSKDEYLKVKGLSSDTNFFSKY